MAPCTPPEFLRAHFDSMHTSRNSQAHLTEPSASPQKPPQPCTTHSHCEHTSNPAGTQKRPCTPTDSWLHAESLTLHAQHQEITRCVHPLCPAGPHCAHCNIGTSVRTPSALARSPEPRPPASGREPPPGLPFRPHPSRASRHLAWRRPQPILGAGRGGPRSPRGRLFRSRRTAPI